MDSWFEGIPTVLALVAAAIGASVFALALAHIPRRAFPARTAPASTPHATIERLAALADLTRAEGILSAENQVDPDTEPLLAQGLRLVVDGVAPDEITRQLDEALDATVRPTPWPAQVVRAVGRIPAVPIACGAAIPLIFLLAHAQEPELSPRLGATAAALVFFALTGASAAAAMRTRKPAEGARLLCGVMHVVGATLIRSGCDGNTVRSRLTALLPPSQRASAAIAKAA